MPDLKCRFCNFTARKFRTTKGGKRISGFTVIRNHVWDEHPEKAAGEFRRWNT